MRIEFTAELGDGQFIEIKDPKRMSWGKQKAIAKAFKDESMDSNLDVAERVLIALAKAGHILDEDNVPVNFPITEENIDKVPAVVIEKVAQKFGELKAEATPKN